MSRRQPFLSTSKNNPFSQGFSGRSLSAKKREVKNILKKYGLKPKKYLGQNFLISPKALGEIIKAAQIKKNDIVLEIGPGTGILTEAIAKKAKRVIAIEKDKSLFGFLKKKAGLAKNVELINGDALKIDAGLLFPHKKYKVVANLPYYISSPIIQKFLALKNPPFLMALMVQKEVGERICSTPPKMSKLSVFSQLSGEVKIIARLSKKSFYPQPKVDAVILKITPVKAPLTRGLRPLFSEVVKAGFSHPRKQLANNLSSELGLPKEKTARWLRENRLSPQKRPGELRVEEWIKLAKTLRINRVG